MEWDLLEKTTFWVEQIELEAANLGEVAAAAARALGLRVEEVIVVDVRPGVVAFDVLRRQVPAEAVAGKERAVLEALRAVAGVKLGAEAGVHSEGVLGLIALAPQSAKEVLAASEKMARQVAESVAKRAIVFASGAEVIAGKIEDTNSPYIVRMLGQSGFTAHFGGILEDSAASAAARIEDALAAGYGLVITTGGVGAEDKDFSVEAVLRLDPSACTPWILKFNPDYRRHHKEGVRIAVGHVGIAKLVALPGPHEEVRLACDRLLEGLAAGLDAADLAESIAAVLRERWQQAMHGHRA
ncbi:MAG: molybdopterin-binding protein [Chloroflexi bacterium]|nr:molybdopterin-binding protein [Chloroflexota bacterium]